MKRTLLYIALMMGLSVWAMPQVAMADDAPVFQDTADKKKAKKKRAKKRSVAKTFSDVTFFKAAGEEEKTADTKEVADTETADGEGVDMVQEEEETVTPDTRAKYYIYLHSASWCGPCKMLMPEVIKQYPQMRKKKVEVILIGYDSTVPAAQKYLQSYKAEFCGVLSSDPTSLNLPGMKSANAIPYATVVNKKGEVVKEGNAGSIIPQWKQICR